MKNKFKIYLKIIFFYLIIINHVYANEFNFDSLEIKISDNGNIINATEGIATSKDDGIIIKAGKFLYNKKLSTLNATEGIATSKNDNVTIEADKFLFNKNLSTLKATGNVKIRNFKNKILIKSQNIIYNTKDKEIKSKTKSTIEDDLNNFILMESFIFNLNENLIKLNKTKFIDSDKNTLKLDLAFLNLETNKLIGKDISINFNNKFFSQGNEPRLKGATVTSDNNNSIISKGIFTTCKKNDKCPPWQLQAKKIRHDKKKKIIYYDNAWLKIYDKPVFYFPKFFHPDPSVKRQSGFLMPTFEDSSSLGLALNVPYFHVLSENKDFTLSPRLYSNNKALLQSEYRAVNADSKHILDFSLMNEKDSNKNHFFSKSTKRLNFENFDDSEIYLDIQSTSNDTYLKTYKLKSPIINTTNTLKSSFGLNAYRDDLSFSADFHVYENLEKEKTDRFEFVLPSYGLTKIIENKFNLDGNFTFNSSGFVKNYNTNIYEKIVINDLQFDSDYNYFKNGLQKNYKILIKNVNTNSQNSEKYKNTTDHTLGSLFQYNLSYPLKKDSNNYKEILTPVTSFKISPNKSKNNRNEDVRIDVDNIFSLNRIGTKDSVEGGTSLAYGLEYSRLNMTNEKILGGKLAAQSKLEEDKNLSTNSSLGKKSSNIVGNLEINPSSILNLKYDFSLNENLNDTNYQSLTSTVKINNFITSFEYLNENTSASNSYLTNETSYIFNESKKISFKTRKNKETNITEYYNLIYQYRNDCLIAALEYNKDYYTDRDLKPEESIFFKLTIIPFGQTSSPNLRK